MALIMATLGKTFSARADEDDEHPITSSAAQVSRDAAGRLIITIGPAAQKETGLGTELLKPVVRQVEAEAYGFVLDPAPLSMLNSDLLSAQAALDPSEAQYRRTRRLYAEHKNASLRDLQSAQATYLSNKARLQALEQQLRDRWGLEIARMDPRARGALVSALIDRREAIVRVTAPIGDALVAPPRRAEVFVLGHERQPLAARAIYYAPAINPRMQGQAFLMLISTKRFPVRPGVAVSASVPASDKAEQGVIVPRSAVLRYSAREWVYQELDGERFVRREIVPTEITGEGYFVTKDLAPGMRIVVTGAQTLLSQELKAQIHVED